MKVALVHYWLVTMRGGEKVLEELCRLYPGADIFTHVLDPRNISETLKAHRITTSFIGRLPGAISHYQKYLPLMPLALEQLDLRGYDLVISSESGPAKGIITGEDTLHLCYCHSPMRYLWNMYHDYRDTASGLERLLMSSAFHRLRQWDHASSARVDYFIANSTTVARRIAKTYRRPATVIHPPVAIEDFSIGKPEDFYLYCGQLVAYKRADIAVQAFSRMGRKLIVAGEGGELAALKRLAGPDIQFVGRLPDLELKRLYRACRALIFPGEEDFGIVPVEAMASGRPVIAYDKGGIRDTVRDGLNGILFPDQTVEGLVAALDRFDHLEDSFLPSDIAAQTARFSAARFRAEMAGLVELKLAQFRANGPFLS